MYIKSVALTDFRNYKAAQLEFSDTVNIIYGANAAGKTNILESIFYFASGKSFRGCKNNELIRFGSGFGAAEIKFFDNSESKAERGFAIKLSPSDRKLYRNGVQITKMSEFLGYFRAVVFTPDHLGLIKGSPEYRRRFIDMAICQSFPRYVSALSEYSKILVQKNTLLRSKNTADASKAALVDVYNEKMAALGGVICMNRKKYLKQLEIEAAPIHNEMSGETEKLSLHYQSQTGVFGTAAEAQSSLTLLLCSKKDAEIKRQQSIIGPHKDDFSIHLSDKNAKIYGSQGQQRTAVLAMKLAEGELSKQLTGEYPVFLFDDILSELDAARRDYVLNHIGGKQVIITGCECDFFETLEHKTKYYIEKGQVVR